MPAGGFALPRAVVAPAFQRAVGGGGACKPEAGAVDQEPERGEGGDVFGGEDLAEVRLDMRGAGERGVVAHQAQAVAVGGKAPKGVVLGVQVVLYGIGGRPGAVEGEEGRAFVQRVGGRADRYRDATVASQESHGDGGRGKVGEAERLGQKALDEAGGRLGGGKGLLGKVVEMGLTDAERLGDFLAQGQALADAAAHRVS